MARIVVSSATSPHIITEGKFPIAVCACGLSKNKPYCDGSHKKAQGEKSGEFYIYGDGGRTSLSP